MELEILEARPNLSPCTDNSYGIGQSVAITPRTINIFWIAYGVYPKLNKETICIGMCRSLRARLVPKPILHGLAFSGKLCLASGGEPIPLTFFGSEKTRLRGPQGDPVRNPNTYSSFSIFLDGQDEARIASGTNHALHYEGKEIYTDYTRHALRPCLFHP
jgi:hypothetical protein